MGWLGSAFARTLQRRGVPVVGTVRGDTGNPGVRDTVPGNIPVYRFSLGDALPPEIEAAAPGAAVLISVSPFRAALSPDAFERRLEKVARELSEAGVSQIVYTSATSVYPVHIANPREGDAADLYSPRSGISLYRAEASVRIGARAVPVVTLRFGGLFGPGRHPGRFFLKQPLRFPDDPVNLIHLDDCIRVIDLAMTLNDTQVINAVAPVHPERGVFYTAAALDIGEMPPVTVGPSKSATPRIVNTDRLEKTLGYRFVHPDPLALFL